jgi:hypothetical protein
MEWVVAFTGKQCQCVKCMKEKYGNFEATWKIFSAMCLMKPILDILVGYHLPQFHSSN